MSKAKKAKTANNGSATAALQLPTNVKEILALDLSLNGTGLCLYRLEDGNTDTLLIDPGKRRGMERLDYIVNVITQYLKVGDGHPLVVRDDVLVVIENYAFARANQAHQIGELHGVVRYALWKLGVPYVLIAPMQLKKWVTGKGNAEKDLVIKELYKRYGFDVDNNNIADSVGLATLAKALIGKWEKPLVAFQQEVVSKVLKGDTDSE